MMAHRAAARALEASLKDEAAEEYERERVGVSWRMPGGGTVFTSHASSGATITDGAAFMAWVKANYPDQIYQPPEDIRPGWLGPFLKRLQPDTYEEEVDGIPPGERIDAIDPAGGAIVPGVQWVKGGGLASVSVKVDKDAERRMNLAAAAYAQGLGTMPGLESGESHGG
jgi:hypothetical protein